MLNLYSHNRRPMCPETCHRQPVTAGDVGLFSRLGARNLTAVGVCSCERELLARMAADGAGVSAEERCIFGALSRAPGER